MTLLSPLALFVGLAALVPLILHLYQRRRHTVIEFSSNRFFTAEIIRSQRRLRLRRLLLLLLRMATCVLLALALARPILSWGGFAGAAGTRDVVILLDDSLSMQARGSGPYPPAAAVGGAGSRFELARQLALDTLAELRAHDRAAVITFTGQLAGDQAELSEDLLRLSDELAQLQPTFAAGDALAALDRAAELFKEALPRNRLLVVLSDLQAGDWHQLDWPQPLHPVAVALVQLAPPPEDNLVADQLQFSAGAAVVGQPNLLRVRLRHGGPQTVPAELILTVDDQERLRRPVELPGLTPQVERVPLVFDQPGLHRLKVHVQGRDSLSADNTLYATAWVNPRLEVLLVDGQTEAERGRSAAYYLRAALRAVSATGDAIQVDTIRPEQLGPASLAGYRVVILSDVPRLSVGQLEHLEDFVQAGGGLMLVPGDYADRAFYNDVMGAATRPLGGLLPADLGPLVEATETIEPLHILATDVEHPILQRFKGPLRSALAGVSFYRAYATTPRDAWVLATLDQGRPLLLERRYGAGRVLLWTAAPQPRWTDLPLRRAFVPLCSRAVSHLAGAGLAPPEYHVGEDLPVLRGGWDVARPVYVEGPDGVRTRAAIRVEQADPIAYVPADAVTRPGFYRVEWSAAGSAGASAAPRQLAVNVPSRESWSDVLDVPAAEKLAGNWRLNVVKLEDLPAGVDAPGVERRGAILSAGWLSRGAWDALLWTVFLLVLAEPLIANQLIRFRRQRQRRAVRRAA